MQLNWLYTTLLSIIWIAVQANAQSYPSSPVYTPPPDYPPTCTPRSLTITVTSVSVSLATTTVTSVTTSTETHYTQAPYGYDNSYIPPIKKKTGLIIGLVVGLCGLALLLLVALLLLFKRSKKRKAVRYAKETTPVASY